MRILPAGFFLCNRKLRSYYRISSLCLRPCDCFDLLFQIAVELCHKTAHRPHILDGIARQKFHIALLPSLMPLRMLIKQKPALIRELEIYFLFVRLQRIFFDQPWQEASW